MLYNFYISWILYLILLSWLFHRIQESEMRILLLKLVIKLRYKSKSINILLFLPILYTIILTHKRKKCSQIDILRWCCINSLVLIKIDFLKIGNRSQLVDIYDWSISNLWYLTFYWIYFGCSIATTYIVSNRSESWSQWSPHKLVLLHFIKYTINNLLALFPVFYFLPSNSSLFFVIDLLSWSSNQKKIFSPWKMIC